MNKIITTLFFFLSVTILNSFCSIAREQKVYVVFDEKDKWVRWDSIIGYKYTSEYDSVPSYKDKYYYNDSGDLEKREDFRWDELNGKWIFSGKQEYIYNQHNGKIKLELYSLWNRNNSNWIQRSKTELYYDDQGTRTSSISYYNFSEEDINWQARRKSEYFYKDNGRKKSSISYVWSKEFSDWVYEFRWEEEFDLNGNVIFYSRFSWNNLSNKWRNTNKDEYVYDNYGNQISNISYEWNSDKDTLLPRSKYYLIYEMGQKISHSSSSIWNIRLNTWEKTGKSEFDYDNNLNLTKIISFEKNSQNGNWLESAKSENHYDYQSFQKTYSNYKWDNEEQAWIVINRAYITLFIHKNSNALKSDLSDKISLYPIPAEDLINLKIDHPMSGFVEINIYDSQGKLVDQNSYLKEGGLEYQLNISKLIPGIYIMNTFFGNQVGSKRFVKY